MNLRGGWSLIRYTWLSWLQHRSFFFLLAFMWMIPPLIYLFVWMTAAGEGEINGFSRGEFIAYYLVLILVNQVTYSQTNWTLGDRIRDGSINIHLLRPISPLFDILASEIAGKVVYLIFIIPVLTILGIILRPEIAFSPQKILLFTISLCFAWLLRFVWGYWIATLAFWSTRADALLGLQDSLVFLLAGQVAPTALLPGAIGGLAVILPFRYMIGFPVEILTQALAVEVIQRGFLYQIGWLIFAMVLSRTIWKAGIKQYSAVGG